VTPARRSFCQAAPGFRQLGAAVFPFFPYTGKTAEFAGEIILSYPSVTATLRDKVFVFLEWTQPSAFTPFYRFPSGASLIAGSGTWFVKIVDFHEPRTCAAAESVAERAGRSKRDNGPGTKGKFIFRW
jgi:hypothetical protein